MRGPDGAHSWMPMAYNPDTGFVYIPAVQLAGHFLPVAKDPKYSPLLWNGGVGFTRTAVQRGFLLAWDPKQQKEVWRVTYPG
jgi:quinohemoprotein ethanol dehydrogenase